MWNTYGFFHLAFATCPFGVLSMGTGTGWLFYSSPRLRVLLYLALTERGSGHRVVPSPLAAAKQKPRTAEIHGRNNKLLLLHCI